MSGFEGDARTLAGGRGRRRGGDDHVGVADAVARRGHGHRRLLRVRRGHCLVASVPRRVRVPRRRSSIRRRRHRSVAVAASGWNGTEAPGSVNRSERRERSASSPRRLLSFCAARNRGRALHYDDEAKVLARGYFTPVLLLGEWGMGIRKGKGRRAPRG